MKRVFRIALVTFVLLGTVMGAGATPAMASSTDVTYDDDNCGIDNDGIDIDDASNIIIGDIKNNDVVDGDVDLL